MKCWEQTTLRYYYEGLAWGDYPRLIMQRIIHEPNSCHSLLDICSGPGAFSLYSLQQGWETTAVDLSDIALSALREKALEYPRSCFHAVYDDFINASLPQADIAVAACCFYEQMTTDTALQKIIDSAKQIAVFVQHQDPSHPEFLTDGLPIDPEKKPVRWNNYPIEEKLQKLADAQGLTLYKDSRECDFGCLYTPDDEILLDFVSRKTGVTDRQLLRNHLQKIAIPKGDHLWLPNPRAFIFFWLNKTAITVAND